MNEWNKINKRKGIKLPHNQKHVYALFPTFIILSGMISSVALMYCRQICFIQMMLFSQQQRK